MITIHKADQLLVSNTFLFPGGEVGVKLDANNLLYKTTMAPYQIMVAWLQSTKDIVELLLTVDALRRFDPTPIRLFLPYVPYARQDRVCVVGEPFSLKVFAGLINGAGFERVTVVDPHSDVVLALFDRLEVITQLQVINRFQSFLAFMTETRTPPDFPIFVSPDAGANKKTFGLASYFAHAAFIRADKLRDMATGAIKETVVYAEKPDLEGRTIVIADDICDGGKTFTELAKVLKARGAAKVILYVTHGIFSKGLKTLQEGGIDHVYTTDSWSPYLGDSTDFVTILRLEEEFAKSL